MSSNLWKRNVPLFCMLLPPVLFYILFKYLPMLGLVIAFKNYNLMDGIWHSPWTGLNNFNVLFSSPLTLSTIKNTLTLSLLSIFVAFPFPIILAILLNEVRAQWFKKYVQTITYLPHFFSWVIVGGLVVVLFSEGSGFVNMLMNRWFGQTYAFLYHEWSWVGVFLGSGIWKESGFSAIIYLAAIASIDPALYESASLDGANKWRQIVHITLPGIAATVVLMLILSMGSVMEVGFDRIYVLQNGAVANISEVISTYIFRVGIQGGHYSLTTAMGFFESIVGLVFVILANRIARRFGKQLW